MPNKLNLSGLKFGHLTLLKQVKRTDGRGHALWSTRCDCGTVKEIEGRNIVNGETRTCGNCEYSRKLRADANRNRKRLGNHVRVRLLKLQETAEKQRVPCSLSEQQLARIMKEECLYCGQKPEAGKFPPSELTRTESSSGYVEDNVVASCRKCKRMKGDSNHEEFLDHIHNVVRSLHRMISED